MNSKETDLKEKFSPLRKGLLEFLVLKIIATKAIYAAEILAILNKTEFTTQEGTLYPLLSKLRREELLEYTWKESEAGPPRKYYELTAKGKAELKEIDTYWQRIITTINNIK